jgi:hypothetical protein
VPRYFAGHGCEEALGGSDGRSQTSAARASVSVATSVEHQTPLGEPARPSSDELMPTVRESVVMARSYVRGRRRLAPTEAHWLARPSGEGPGHAPRFGWRGGWRLVRGFSDRLTAGVVSWLRETRSSGCGPPYGWRAATGFQRAV